MSFSAFGIISIARNWRRVWPSDPFGTLKPCKNSNPNAAFAGPEASAGKAVPSAPPKAVADAWDAFESLEARGCVRR